MLRSVLLLSLLLGFSALYAQQKPYWTPVKPGQSFDTDPAVDRPGYPKEFKLFELDHPSLRQSMMAITGPGKSGTKGRIALPSAAGQMEEFEITEASNFTPELQNRFPQIRAFSGRSLTTPGSTLKISLDERSVQTMVFRAGGLTEYMEPYSRDGRVYSVYRRQRAAGQAPWACSTPDQALAQGLQNRVTLMAVTPGSGNVLRTMRLAQSCNAEYSNYFGATSSADVAKVLSAFNATLTRCNGVYEKDLALHLNLIADTEKVIYYNASTDPYTTMSSWNSQLQSTLNSVIGAANYDIGHMFGASGGGGNAGCIGCVCVDATKGSGITSPADGIPKGDNFDIDYVAHEVGHQLGANHTFSHSNEGTGVNKEPGSGITIMGYAGITSQDLVNHSIDIFHQTSIEQILVNLNNKSCVVKTTTPNTAPAVSVPGNFTIPISTPFALTGSASDAAGQDLTYCWEQNDNAGSRQTGTSSVASPTKATGPNWISFPATASPTRLFPKLATILAGQNVSGPLALGDAGANTEALSSVSRTLNFRLTVRDNVLYNAATPDVGQTAYGDVVVTVTNTAGPFTVTAPNTAVTWQNGSTQTITWNVANTNAAPINCAQVNILLSTDGGNTFSTLLAGTPNDGSQAVTINASGTFPNNNCRIKIESVGNIFFDIGNAAFTISAPAICGTPSGLQAASISTTGATLSWSAVTGATSYTPEYKAATSTTWIVLPAQAGTSVAVSGLTAATTYDYRVKATCSAGTGDYGAAQFTTSPLCGTPTGLQAASITTTGATLSWSAVTGATSYTPEYKASASATWIVLPDQAGTSVAITGLAASTTYNYRVKATCSAGTGDYASAQFTTAAAPVLCPGPLDVTTNGTLSGAASIPFNTDVKGIINPSSDVDYYKFAIITPGTISLALTTLPTNYDLRLVSSSGTILGTSAKSGTNPEAINYTAAAGTYYAQVFSPKNSNANSCYTLRVNLGTAGGRNEESGQTGTGDGPLASNETLRVHPNPTDNILTIETPWPLVKAAAQLFDQQGRPAMQSMITRDKNTVDVSGLSPGMYILRVVEGGRTAVTKVIRK